MAPKLRAAGYARVSVDREDSSSISLQIDQIAQKCQAEGWAFDPKKDLYIDEGLSGSKRKVRRPAFEKMIANAARYDRIVVYRIDRLSRRVAELHTVIEDMKDLDIVVVSTSENLTTASDQERTLITMVSAIAAGEAEAISKRVSAVQKKMAEEGKWKGGSRPYGWVTEKLKGGGLRLVLKKDEAVVLRKAIKLILSGKSIGGTARELNKAGHKTYKNLPFSPQTISHVLRSELLLGRHVVNKELKVGSDGKPITPHEPLITLEEWVKLQAALSRLRIVRPKKGGAILAGVIFCNECGGKMQGSSTETNQSANYRCRNKYALMNGKCSTGSSVRAVAADELVSLAVLEVLKKKKSIRGAGKRMRQTYAAAVRLRRDLEDKVEDAKRIHSNLRDHYLRGDYKYKGGEADYQNTFSRATTHLVKAHEALDELDEVDDEPADLYPWTTVVALEQKWERATNAEKNLVIRALIDKVVVKPRSAAWKHRGLDPDRIEITWRSV